MDKNMNNFTLPWSEWKVERLLGRGSFGEVYQVVRDEFGTSMRAAIKVIRIPMDDTELEELEDSGISARSYLNGLVTDITNEIILMQTLKGAPNIVGIDDYKIVESTERVQWTIYIRMELLTDLNRYRREHPLSYEQIIQLGCDICNALEICRRKKIVHRDIKPSNIFVSPYGEYKLGDFGISKHTDNTQSAFSTRKGTYSYMAPEVYRGEKYGYSIDLYSLGVVLYQLANNGRLPFYPPMGENVLPGDADQALEKRNMGIPFPDPANGGEELGDILRKACHIDPRQRYTSPAEMHTALRRLIHREEPLRNFEEEKTIISLTRPETIKKSGEIRKTVQPVKVNDTEKQELSEKKPRNHYKIIILAVIALLGIGGAGISFYMNNRGNKSEKSVAVTETIAETETEMKSEKATEKLTEANTEMEVVTEGKTEAITETETEMESVAFTEPITEKVTESEQVTEKVTEPEPITEKVTEIETEKITESIEEIKSITATVNIDGEKSKVKIQNLTDIKMSKLTLYEAARSEESGSISSEDIQAKKKWNIDTAKGKTYHIRMENEEGTDGLEFYNVSFENVDEIQLCQEDGYTYVTYKDKENTDENSEKYRTRTYDESQLKYVMTSSGLNVRALPDNKAGAVVKKLAVADEVEVCGDAKGLISGEESDWYLIKVDGQYGYISANADYTTDDKATAELKKAEILAAQAAAAAAQQSYSSYSGSSGSSSGGGSSKRSSGGSSGGVSISSW